MVRTTTLDPTVDDKETQVQNYAMSANLFDPFLRKWIKLHNNPLIVADESINKTKFGDPTIAWLGQDWRWRMIGLHEMDQSRSLHSSAKIVNWQCVDLFPVSLEKTNGLNTSFNDDKINNVMKVSLDITKFDYYTIGTYDTKKDRYVPDNTMING
ncbi:hypothetical protein R3W88_026881 [Solanum pinnatisectum]|uniref:Glycosyl hydrolase family 32 N-terminal domain-containing protein n=1 Tax=Solanum pinnatisectum TaxID=50273 RepID=A0AAV9LEJ4_9SOLN|nr:hypothetical protein R3W88_026881 [Solanum pinnatisectum]